MPSSLHNSTIFESVLISLGAPTMFALFLFCTFFERRGVAVSPMNADRIHIKILQGTRGTESTLRSVPAFIPRTHMRRIGSSERPNWYVYPSEKLKQNKQYSFYFWSVK